MQFSGTVQTEVTTMLNSSHLRLQGQTYWVTNGLQLEE